jgi:predicted nucleotidyltransferase component of viral defense system
MASSPPSGSLTDLQWRVLRAFFEREHGFHLTGGAALAGFYLGHRETSDLDLFTHDDAAFERGRYVLDAVADALGAELLVTQDAPGFRRTVLSARDQAVVVDLVRDRAPASTAEKPKRDGIRLDPPEEILANKLNAIVGRGEERDLVDLFFLEKAGYAVEDALPGALAKDGGCTPATLAWVLSEITIADDAPLPSGVTADELRVYLTDLIRRLRRRALPA